MTAPYAIHWFRRDLRVAGNPALQWSWKHHEGRVVGLFCFDRKFLARPDFSANRFQFFLKTLAFLQNELKTLGGDLLVLDACPDEAFTRLLPTLGESSQGRPAAISWNRDYEPYAVQRDARIARALQERGIAHHTERDHCLMEPIEISKDGEIGAPYQVFTPFSRRWLERMQTADGQSRIDSQRSGLMHLQALKAGKTKPAFHLRWSDLLSEPIEEDILHRYSRENSAKTTVPIPDGGSLAALRALETFEAHLSHYAESRDLPSVEGTSRLSIFFKNGSLTVSQVIAALDLKHYDKKATTGPEAFLKELIWREFYYHILGRFPRVEHEAFQLKLARIPWQNREDWFGAWKEGRTGFPIVDAGMRQLKQTGWMHNRLRMIVASFLTKDLHIDWKWGERYFMEQLLDGDLAPNNGGWQWAASTGCDPQPYFRIFNPKLQSETFDPDGTFIRHFVPELAHLPAADIHEPPRLLRNSYPAPLVDHAVQREKTLALYRRCEI